jgi:hypothetical protein
MMKSSCVQHAAMVQNGKERTGRALCFALLEKVKVAHIEQGDNQK